MRQDKNITIMKLNTNIKFTCSFCDEYKFLEYLVLDEEIKMFSICKECREDLIKQKGGFED